MLQTLFNTLWSWRSLFGELQNGVEGRNFYRIKKREQGNKYKAPTWLTYLGTGWPMCWGSGRVERPQVYGSQVWIYWYRRHRVQGRRASSWVWKVIWTLIFLQKVGPWARIPMSNILKTKEKRETFIREECTREKSRNGGVGARGGPVVPGIFATAHGRNGLFSGCQEDTWSFKHPEC